MGTPAASTATSRRRLMTLWVAATVLVCLAIGVLAFVIARQAQALEVERRRDAAERLLLARRDTVAARISALRTWLAEASAAASFTAAPEWLDAEQVLVLESGVDGVAPLAGELLFTPDASALSDPDTTFLPVERLEFGGAASEEVVSGYERLAGHSSADVRAGARIRLARVLTRRGEAAAALDVLRRLYNADAGGVDDVPAALVARVAMLPLLERLGRTAEATALAREIARGLESGRWRLPAATWRFYVTLLERGGHTVSPPASRLARTLAAHATLAGVTASDAPTVVQTASGPVLLLPRSSPTRRVIALIDPGALLPSAPGDDTALTDAEGRHLAGARPGSAPAVKTITVPVGAAGLLLHAAAAPIGRPSYLRADVVASAAAMVVIGCLAAGSWGLGRGLSRELRLNELQSHFIAAVSHELRTPITSLRYMTDMLSGNRVPPERLPEYYDVLGRESRRLQSTIEGLLQFGRLEAGIASGPRERVTVAALVGTAVDDFEAGRDGDGPRLRVAGHDHPHAAVSADVPALLVALRNLLDNAVKYSPDAEIVEVDTTTDATHAHIRVRDFGSGVAPEEQAVIFRRFTRGVAAQRTGAPGTGIGLALSQHIAASHGGMVELERTGPDGSVFALRLPLAP